MATTKIEEADLASFATMFPELTSFTGEDDTSYMVTDDEHNVENETEICMWLDTAYDIHKKSPRATLFLAAHFMELDRQSPAGSETSNNNNSTVDVQTFISRERIGPYEKELERVQQSSGGSGTTRQNIQELYNTTHYGRVFLMLEQRCTAFSVRLR